MSDIENLFLAAYPLWPKALLAKFAGLLSLEVAKFNPEINPQIIEQYKKIGNDIKFYISAYIDNVSYLLSPSNQAFVEPNYYGPFSMRVDASRPKGFTLANEDLFGSNQWFRGKVLYDKRIFNSVYVDAGVDYSLSGYSWRISYLFIMSYDSVFVDGLNASPYGLAKVTLKKYDGAKTALAMVENGVSVDVDQKLLSEFVTFLNAYNKYSGELAAENSLQAEKNRQTMTDYKNSISEKLNSRKNELNDLRTQISFAAKNESASAKRDMQSLTLSAQSLMLQLQDKLK